MPGLQPDAYPLDANPLERQPTPRCGGDVIPAKLASQLKTIAALVVIAALVALTVIVARRALQRDPVLDAPIESTPPPAQTSRLKVRGVYGRDSSATGLQEISSTGFNTVTVVPDAAQFEELNRHDLQGVVWLGAYHNTNCSFQRDDRWVTDVVNRFKDQSSIAAYQVADEPSHNMCPEAPEQIRERAELIESLDPDTPTYVTVPTWDGKEGFPYEHFAGTTDIMGLVVYPCLDKSEQCWFTMIDRAITEADRDDVGRYWAVLQNFDTDWYRMPSSEELQGQFRRWAQSRMSGYFVYQWTPGQSDSDERKQALARLNDLTKDD